MTIELTYLTCTAVLALFQILLAAQLRTVETGLSYNAGPRDMPARIPPGLLTGRVIRAQHNLFETLPLFALLVIVAHMANLETSMTALGAALYFWARVAYLPLYAFGIKYLRSLAWAVGILGIILFLIAILHPQ